MHRLGEKQLGVLLLLLPPPLLLLWALGLGRAAAVFAQDWVGLSRASQRLQLLLPHLWRGYCAA